MLGLIGRKVGMTQIFDENGVLIPTTVIQFEPNVVVGHRTPTKDGYSALIVGTGALKQKRATKPYCGQFPEKIQPTKILREFRDFEQECAVGQALDVSLFEGITLVDVHGTTKGKGYQGVMKRHGFAGGPKRHGSKFHRAPGSTGMAAWPSRVIKGQKMPGRMGNDNKIVQNLRLVRIDPATNIMLVRGAVPGRRKSIVVVTKAKKA